MEENRASVADSSVAIPKSRLVSSLSPTVCHKCGSLVDSGLLREHKAMHEFFTLIVTALEDHKKEIEKKANKR